MKVLYHICEIKKKQLNFEQHAHLHHEGPKIAICGTASNMVFVLISSFTIKDEYFRVAIAEACNGFSKISKMLLHFGYTQNLEIYNPQIHQVIPPKTHPFS